jgi:ribosomal protein S21
MVEVRKREKESTEGLLRRFNRRVQNSSVLQDARGARFRGKLENRTKKRASAISRNKFRIEKEKLVKLGKVSPTHRLPNKYKLKIKALIRSK